jgi:hypothetical protein
MARRPDSRGVYRTMARKTRSAADRLADDRSTYERAAASWDAGDWRAVVARNPLLSKGESNTKTKKLAKELGVRSWILHLAPHTNGQVLMGSGKVLNVCPWASLRCKDACLFIAGLASVHASINAARIRKTHAYAADPTAFVQRLAGEIARHVKAARRDGLAPAVRLNGTADIAWERMPVDVDGVTYPNLMTAFPQCAFYDYTKGLTRLKRALPANYAVTFSLAEDNDAHALEALALGYNVAAVLNVPKGQPMPATWSGYAVVDGDEHDFRHLDPRGGYIIGLRPKGPAIGDTGGFVRDVDATLRPDVRPDFAAARQPAALPAVDADALAAD